MTADAWVWVSLGLLLVLLGARAWVVETGHHTLGRTPVRVKVLSGACGVALALVVGLVTVNGGARLVWMVLHPVEAQAQQDAAKAAEKAAEEAAKASATAVPPAAPAPTPTPGAPAAATPAVAPPVPVQPAR